MKRHIGRAYKGSQLHLQDLVNGRSQELNRQILSNAPLLDRYAAADPEWVSPLAKDDYMEYQDRRFLAAVGLHDLSIKLADFWPRGGPVWDALATVRGKDGSYGVIILEAKSHVLEISGPNYACGAKGKSLEKISASMNAVKRALGVKPEVDWLGDYYQYANRVAHLYFLNVIVNVPTWMVFLYFVGDLEQQGPMTCDEWMPALAILRSQVGLPRHHLLDERLLSLFPHV